MDGCTKQYSFSLAIFLLLFLALELSITFDRTVGVPGYGKDVVDVLNDRYKWIFKLAMEIY